jgi:dTDP-4-amino-4,6-dideoxygalactose transaminase
MVERVLRTTKGKKFRAMMPVHTFGKPCNMDALMLLARLYKLKVIEDSCEMMGVAGLRGDISCYSTYVCHLISTGVGGLALTNNARLAKLMWSYANHGRRESGKFVFDRIGYSARATELQAALGLEELKKLPYYLKRRRAIAEEFNERLSVYPDLCLPHVMSDDPHAFMMYPIVLKEGSRVRKSDLCRHLAKHGIETRDMLPLTNQPCYRGALGSFAVSDWVNRCGFYIGCHPLMTRQDIDHVVYTFGGYLRGREKTTIEGIRKASSGVKTHGSQGNRHDASSRDASRDDRAARRVECPSKISAITR